SAVHARLAEEADLLRKYRGLEEPADQVHLVGQIAAPEKRFPALIGTGPPEACVHERIAADVPELIVIGSVEVVAAIGDRALGEEARAAGQRKIGEAAE